jgi:hypothetical protein
MYWGFGGFCDTKGTLVLAILVHNWSQRTAIFLYFFARIKESSLYKNHAICYVLSGWLLDQHVASPAVFHTIKDWHDDILISREG